VGRSKIIILDTTLRDGDQSPGYSLSPEQKLIIAGYLEKMGVDIIEAGFPASSPGQFSAVQRISESLQSSAVSAMARAKPEDIKKAGEAIRNARVRYIHTSIATSPIHRRAKLRKSRGEILKIAADAVEFASEYADFVEIGAEDATRTEPEFLAEFCDITTRAGASVVNIADTVGYIHPAEFHSLIDMLFRDVRAFRNGTARISVHCHNDLGLALANTLTGLSAGAVQAEVTLLGLGERGGNTPLEELAAVLMTRRDFFDKIRTSLRMEHFAEAARTMSCFTGISISPNKPVAGRNAFAHTSGIHQNGMLASSSTYSVLAPDMFGLPPHRLVLSRHSGISGYNACVRELTGDHLYTAEDTGLLDEFKSSADAERNVTVTSLLTQLLEEGIVNCELWYLQSCSYSKSEAGDNCYTITVKVTSSDGKNRRAVSSDSTGPGAIMTVMKALFRINPEIINYSYSGAGGLSAGSECLSITAEYEGRSYSDESYGDDYIELFIKSYLNILNRISAKFQLSGI